MLTVLRERKHTPSNALLGAKNMGVFIWPHLACHSSVANACLLISEMSSLSETQKEVESSSDRHQQLRDMSLDITLSKMHPYSSISF